MSAAPQLGYGFDLTLYYSFDGSFGWEPIYPVAWREKYDASGVWGAVHGIPADGLVETDTGVVEMPTFAPVLGLKLGGVTVYAMGKGAALDVVGGVMDFYDVDFRRAVITVGKE